MVASAATEVEEIFIVVFFVCRLRVGETIDMDAVDVCCLVDGLYVRVVVDTQEDKTFYFVRGFGNVCCR